MKKTFIEPNYHKYELSLNEDIIASWRPESGEAEYHFSFIQYAEDGSPVSDPGCYDMLNNFYPTAGHMQTRNSFINWYSGISIIQTGESGEERNGYAPYGDYIDNCEGQGLIN